MITKFYNYIVAEVLVKNPTQNHLLQLQQILPFILIQRLGGDQEVLQGMEMSCEIFLCQNSRSSAMHQMHSQPLKIKMYSPGRSSTNFSSQCFPDFSRYFLQYFHRKLKIKGLIFCRNLYLFFQLKAVSRHYFIPSIDQLEFQGHPTRKVHSYLQWIIR